MRHELCDLGRDVEPPVSFFRLRRDSLDWLEFRVDNAYDLYDWRIKLFLQA